MCRKGERKREALLLAGAEPSSWETNFNSELDNYNQNPNIHNKEK